MKLKKKYQIILLALIWFSAGVFLLRKGIYLSMMGLTDESKLSFLHRSLASFLPDSLQIGLLFIVLGLFLGNMKAKKVFRKVIDRILKSLEAYQEQAPLSAIFNIRFFLLIIIMMTLGWLLNVLNFPTDIRAIVNVTIGSALMQAAIMLYRASRTA